MADRVVSVRLDAKVEGFVAGMRKARASVDDLTKSDVPKTSKAFGQLANTAALAGVAVAGGLGLAVARFAEFDQAMSAVKANTGATGAQLGALRDAAIKLGADSQFSAKEAAQGVNELAKAGVKTADILGGGLKGSLDLAAAGQIEVAQAAETTASALTQFGLSGDNATHVADLLTNGANKAQGGVLDLGQALQQSGLVAASTGLTIEETTAGLTAFAAAGLVGSDAGTSFKTMLQRLSAPSAEASKLMEKLGINAYDSQGQFVGLASVAGQLQSSLGNLTPEQRNSALATIFGSDAIRTANVLYKEGAAGIQDWTKQVSEQGAAAAQAAALTDNLKGDIERLGGAFDSVLIQTGSSANSSLRGLVQATQGFVEVIGRVPGPILATSVGVTSLALIVPKGVVAWKAYQAQLVSTGLSLDAITAKSATAGAAIGFLGKAAIVVGVAAVAGEIARLAPNAQASTVAVGDLSASLQSLGGDSSLNTSGLQKLFQQSGPLAKNVEDTSSALRAFAESAQVAFGQNLTDQADRFGDFGLGTEKFAGQVKQIDEALAGLVANGHADQAAIGYRQLMEAIKAANAEGANISVTEVAAQFTAYKGSLDNTKAAADSAAGANGKLSAAVEQSKQSADDAKKALDDLRNAIDGLGGPTEQARAASRGFQAAIDAAAASVKENGRRLDEGSAKGRANAEALDALAAKTKDKVNADYALTRSTAVATATMQAGRDAFVAAAIAAGSTRDAAEKLATKLGLVPKDVAILVKQTGAEAAGSTIDAVARKSRTATIKVRYAIEGRLPSGGLSTQGGLTRASGGPIYGPGTKTSDSVPLWGSVGEYMQRAAAVDKYGLAFMNSINSLRFPVDQARGYATGGPIRPAYAPAMPYVISAPASPTARSITNDQRVMPAVMNVYEGGAAGVRADAERERFRRGIRGSM